VTHAHFPIDAPPLFSTVRRQMAPSYNLASEAALRDARDEVLKWLRAPNRSPSFLAGLPNDELAHRHAEIAHQLRVWLATTDFQLEIVSLDDSESNACEGRWTHKGADFVGFKQPAAASTTDDAVILACAALLRNEWCRARLPSS
jgi:hypothetical protein